MGPLLRGATPPFTPSGKAAMLRSRLGEANIDEPIQAGHAGLLLRWRTHRRHAEELLPPPLKPVPGTDIIYCFLNQAQSGQNMFRPRNATGNEYVRSVNPQHFNWHEGMFWILCDFRGMAAHYSWQSFQDVDHGVLLSLYNGYQKKLATFDKRFPAPGQPLQSEMRVGGTAEMHLSRFGQRIVSVRFQAEREMAADEISAEILQDHVFGNSISVRYFPDYVDAERPPLVHQLILRRTDKKVPKAWAGPAEVELSSSDDEELHLIAPIEMLESYFVHFQYLSGPVAAKTRVLHDYRTEG